MGLVNKAFAIFLFVSLAACASSPNAVLHEPGKHAKPAPATPSLKAPRRALSAERAAARLFTAELSICPGMGVSNAPALDSHKRVIGFEPLAYVSGALLARAPVDACVSSGFGPRRGGASAFHHGLDLFTRGPEPIYAAGDGIVESVTTMRGYGRVVVIRHNARVKTRYAHLSSYAKGLKVGDRVRLGAVLGKTGASGNATAIHLHYEIVVDGKRRDPLSIGKRRLTASAGT